MSTKVSDQLRESHRVLMFGHDPNVVEDRSTVLREAGYEPVMATTADEVEAQVQSGGYDALLIGSQTGPLTRIRLAEAARSAGVAVVHIAYRNHPESRVGEVYVARPLGRKELVDALHTAIHRKAGAGK